jgi:hypothetical protein
MTATQNLGYMKFSSGSEAFHSTWVSEWITTDGQSEWLCWQGPAAIYPTWPKLSCGVVSSRQQCHHRSREISIVGSHYLATTSEVYNTVVACAAVTCKVCRLVRALEWYIVTCYQPPVNPIIIPNPMASHCHVTVHNIAIINEQFCYFLIT